MSLLWKVYFGKLDLWLNRLDSVSSFSLGKSHIALELLHRRYIDTKVLHVCKCPRFAMPLGVAACLRSNCCDVLDCLCKLLLCPRLGLQPIELHHVIIVDSFAHGEERMRDRPLFRSSRRLLYVHVCKSRVWVDGPVDSRHHQFGSSTHHGYQTGHSLQLGIRDNEKGLRLGKWGVNFW